MNFIRKHKIITAVLLVLLFLLVGTGFYLWSLLDLIQYDENSIVMEKGVIVEGEMQQEPTIVEKAPEKISETLPVQEKNQNKESDVINILIIGTDERTSAFNENARSDAMILVSLNKETKVVKLISLERAMGVPVLDGIYKGQYDWLTHIFRYGGADLLVKTVNECFDLKIEHYVRVNFNIFRQCIDSLGGVDIELTQAEADYMNYPYSEVHDGEDMQPVSAGMNHLNGTTALAYARIRKIDSDWKRVERQRNVIMACIQTIKTNLDLLEVNRIAKDVLPMIMTNLTKTEIAELMLVATGFWNCEIDQMTIPAQGTYGNMIGMDGRSLFAVDFEENIEILHKFIYGKETIEE